MSNKRVVLVTCGSKDEADRIASALVAARLAACVNILQAPVRSIYRWRGKVESAAEHLLIIKTSQQQFAAVERAVKRLHSYDVPEVIALPIAAGSQQYLSWLADCIGERSRPRRTGGRAMRKGRR
jgi:periplasmic divalent cation tolerance protein